MPSNEAENKSPSDLSIRLAKDEDFEEIYNIWLEGISSSFNTSETNFEELKDKFKKLFNGRSGIFNYWVAVIEGDKIAGWQSLNKCTMNPLKDNLFAESSTYVKTEYRKHKIGDHLLADVVAKAKSSALQYITAYVNKENTASRKITNHLGFIEIGELPMSNKLKQSIEKIYIINPL